MRKRPTDSGVKIIAEIGINHNGDLDLAKTLIQESAKAGADYVKFQKRNPDSCVPEAQKQVPRSTPWGTMPYIEYKHRMEFDEDQYNHLINFAQKCGVWLFASVWDLDSVGFMAKFKGGVEVMKIPSAKMTDDNLVLEARRQAPFLLVSTGMSAQDEIRHMLRVGNPDVVFHSVSSYPTVNSDCQIGYVDVLKKMCNCPVGYSGHEADWLPTLAAVAKGAMWVERHVTVDKKLWGSDQKASLNMDEFARMVNDIRLMEEAIGEMKVREVLLCEQAKRKSLRG